VELQQGNNMVYLDEMLELNVSVMLDRALFDKTTKTRTAHLETGLDPLLGDPE
jgi:hypothetical protein